VKKIKIFLVTFILVITIFPNQVSYSQKKSLKGIIIEESIRWGTNKVLEYGSEYILNKVIKESSLNDYNYKVELDSSKSEQDGTIIKNVRTGFNKYCNSRYNYCLDYPVFLIPQNESNNGDGRKFISDDLKTEMSIFGSNYPYSLNSYLSISSENKHITYKVVKNNWYVISGYENGLIFYQKTVLKDGVFKTFHLTYPKSIKKDFDFYLPIIVKSFD
jgi:hypothetical protein